MFCFKFPIFLHLWEFNAIRWASAFTKNPPNNPLKKDPVCRKTESGHQIRLLPSSPTCIWVQKSLQTDCRRLSNAGANAVYKISYASVFLLLAKRFLKASEAEVKSILPTCKTKIGTGGKRRKTLRSPKSAAPSPKSAAEVHV